MQLLNYMLRSYTWMDSPWFGIGITISNTSPVKWKLTSCLATESTVKISQPFSRFLVWFYMEPFYSTASSISGTCSGHEGNYQPMSVTMYKNQVFTANGNLLVWTSIVISLGPIKKENCEKDHIEVRETLQEIQDKIFKPKTLHDQVADQKQTPNI